MRETEAPKLAEVIDLAQKRAEKKQQEYIDQQNKRAHQFLGGITQRLSEKAPFNKYGFNPTPDAHRIIPSMQKDADIIQFPQKPQMTAEPKIKK